MNFRLRSMTGYGRGDHLAPDGTKVVVEIKSVNHRYLEISSRIPRGWMGIENLLKDRIKDVVSRGKVDVVITLVESGMETRKPFISYELAREYFRVAQQMGQDFGIPDQLTATDILRLPEVLSFPNEVPEVGTVWEIIEPALQGALQQFLHNRTREGTQLALDLKERVTRLLELVGEVELLYVEAAKKIAERLRARIAELMEGLQPDPARLAQEAAFLAEREDITEEIVRLKCHLEHFLVTLSDAPPVGKQMDFLLQEILRETNTSCSKVSEVEIIHRMLNVKNEVEKMREQIQNLE